jgi:hypothetical protein
MRSASGGQRAARRAITRRHDVVGEVLRQHAHRRRRVERRLARQHAIERRAQAVNVRARVEILAAHLLRRHVIRRADHLPARADRRCAATALAQLRETEVEHLRVLDTLAAVHDHQFSASDRGGRCPPRAPRSARADLRERSGLRARSSTVLAAEQRREIVALDELHHQVKRAVGLAEVERLTMFG